MADRLRAIWHFDDLDSTDDRFRMLLDEEPNAGARAEILTQLARVQGLRGRFEAGERLIEEAEALAGTSAAASVRIDLERGRLRRSSGDAEQALPLFESAYEAAIEAREFALAADAAHMAALAAPGRDGMHAWTRRGIELAESADDPSVRYWLGPLLNNLGWERFESAEYDEALAAFERALHEREAHQENTSALAFSRYAVGKTLHALGRTEEATPLLERAVEWAETEGTSDGWFHEALASGYADLGRAAEAATHAEKALDLLPEADASFEPDGERAAELRRLAGKRNPDFAS